MQIALLMQLQVQAHIPEVQPAINANNASKAQQEQQTINAQQQVLIEVLPPVLVLHIKRFCYDKESRKAVKVGKRVRFDGELNIGSGESLFPFFLYMVVLVLGACRRKR